MKKAWGIAIIASIIMMLAGCGGTTKPHVSIHLLGPHLPYRSAVACVSADCGPYAVTLSWAGITVSGLAGYYITLNGSQIADVASSPYIYHGIDCGVTITMGVQAHGTGGTSSIHTASYTSPACGVGPTFPLAVSSNGRYLQTASGQPWLMVGDSPQSGMGNLSTTTMTSYLADRAAHGINAVWEWMPCDGYGSFCNSNGTTYDGIAPFTGMTSPSNADLCGAIIQPCTTPNAAYWTRMHAMVAQAQADGIAMFLDPLGTQTARRHLV